VAQGYFLGSGFVAILYPQMTTFIAIDGPGGSGKTYIARVLARQLDAAVFHLDDYGNDYQPFIGIPALVDQLRQAQADVVIYEGVGVFDTRFDEFHAFRIFVNTPHDVRESRVAGRDVPAEDRSAEAWRKIFKIWQKAEKSYFSPELVQRAQWVVNNSTGQAPDLQPITQRLKNF
jgi:uridine kinase